MPTVARPLHCVVRWGRTHVGSSPTGPVGLPQPTKGYEGIAPGLVYGYPTPQDPVAWPTRLHLPVIGLGYPAVLTDSRKPPV